jgi:CheY-like chemotaxis protein
MAEHILIVDDERAIAQLTAIWLEQVGYKPLLAFDGHTALSLISEFLPSLIFLDIRMPDLDGFEINRRIKGTPGLSDIPVIFLSAHAQESARQAAVLEGAASFLPKPYEFKDLIAAASRALTQAGSRLHSLCGAHA